MKSISIFPFIIDMLKTDPRLKLGLRTTHKGKNILITYQNME